VGRKIGDKLNGYRAETAELPSLGQAARWLCDRALEFYPESEFAKDYLRTHRDYQPLTQAAEPASAIGAAISMGVVPTECWPGLKHRVRAAGRNEKIAEFGMLLLTPFTIGLSDRP
jgi:hypothetical protein